ncbi:MAG: hypothetical protein IPM96_01600 [Ignavibacteria bacterium]|nr:hypothetical protein [Ignavibacteria bacterium]
MAKTLRSIQTNYGNAKTSYFAGIFIIAMSTILLEFTLTRVLSVSLWYHFAFMIISVALLGFGISGVVLALSSRIEKIQSDKLLSILSLLYGVSVLFSFITMNKIPFDPFSLLTDSVQLIYLPIYYLLITLPFFFAGLVISVLLVRYKKEVSKLYFYDLIGAGLSCFIFIFLIPLTGGNGAIAVVAAMGFFAAMIFSYEMHKTISMISFILLALSLTFLINTDERLPINVTSNKLYGNYIKDRPDLKIRTDWNIFSKIDVMRDEESSQDGYDIYLAIIDAGNATTNIPNVKSLPPKTKPADASNLAYLLKDSAEKVFIIGSAGGGEILAGLYHNAKNIKAVEINGILNDYLENTLSYWTGPLVKNNKSVNLITDDARNVITSKRIVYDVIVSAHTISASAMSSGAMSMVENYILTKEAVSEYLHHLDRSGVLYISRPETQIPKLITTLKEARLENSKGIENSKDCFIIFRRPPNEFEGDKSFLAGVLYKKDGFSAEDVIRIRSEAGNLSLDLLYDPLSESESFYKTLIDSDNFRSLAGGKDNVTDAGLEPATDDKPFFDQNIGFGNLTFDGIRETFSQGDKAILALKDKPVAETTLIVILIQTLITAFAFLILPLLIAKRKLTSSSTGKIFLIYFAAIGLGYIMMQISLIQKFTLMLGQPVYTILTVISSMLIFSGIGSKYSDTFLKNNKHRIQIIFFLIALTAILIGVFNSYLFTSMARFDLIYRVLISILLIAPLRFFMSMPFPLGMKKIDDSEKSLAAFSWAVNGFFSVIGSVLAIIFAMTMGFRFVFIFVSVCYLIAMLMIIFRTKSLQLKT